MRKRLDHNQIAPEGLEALGGVHGYIAESSLPATLVDLVYLRVSQITDCAYSLDTHTRGLPGRGQSVEKLALAQARQARSHPLSEATHGSWHEMSHGFSNAAKISTKETNGRGENHHEGDRGN